MDPQPVVSWFRFGTFVSAIGAALVALDAVSPEVKTVTVIVLIVVNAALTVFFPTVAGQSVARAVTNKIGGK